LGDEPIILLVEDNRAVDSGADETGQEVAKGEDREDEERAGDERHQGE